MSEILTLEEFRDMTAGNCGCCQENAECADVAGSDGCCHDADDRRHGRLSLDEWESGCDCHTLMRHDAALRAENERLAAALREIDARTGHFGEAPPPPEWMPMLSLIAWAGKTARAALAEHRDAKGTEAGR